MKLSDAILEGCKIRPYKARSVYFDGNYYACTLGAAMIGINPENERLVEQGYTGAYILFPELHQVPGRSNPYDRTWEIDTKPPKFKSLHGLIAYLNDKTDMTREQIAAWLKRCGK